MAGILKFKSVSGQASKENQKEKIRNCRME
jgi:hypothetical protein